MECSLHVLLILLIRWAFFTRTKCWVSDEGGGEALKGGVGQQAYQTSLGEKSFFNQAVLPGCTTDCFSRTSSSSCSVIISFTRLLLGQYYLCFLFQFALIFVKKSKLLGCVAYFTGLVVLKRWFVLGFILGWLWEVHLSAQDCRISRLWAEEPPRN